ncbi:MAG TPA: hypothetical protein VEY11_14580 [Pyrinomonadaceae bacterium]|nr:hypothetical protein [Pyrinomonadaceae bacterium]
MRPQGQTSFLLDGRTGWRTAAAASVSVGDRAGIRLAADPAGPLGLASADGSLGGIVLPAGMALDADNTLYLLGQAKPGVRRFDAERREFVPLPSIGAEVGGDVRQFRNPASIGVAGHNLYVADSGNRRVQVFALGTLVVRHVWEPRDEDGRRTHAGDPAAWLPLDVASHDGLAYILDARYRRVYRHRPGTDNLVLLLEGRPSPSSATPHPASWTRLALDREGRIYLFDTQAGRIDIHDRDGLYIETKTGAGDIADRFDAPPLRLSRGKAGAPWRFCLPESLMRPCDRRATGEPPSASMPHGSCAARPPGGLLFDREGERARADEEPQAGPKLYATEGEWTSDALDSKIYRCQWHRIELELGELPAGTRVEVRTYTDAAPLTSAEVGARHEKLWSKGYVATGQLTRPRNSSPAKGRGAARETRPDDASAQGAGTHEFLVQSHEGQYLWFKVLLTGDGYATPAVRSVRIHYPRDSYVGYLPAVYSSDDESRRFLERFLSIFQTEWDSLEGRIRDIPALFDPQAVPEGKFLEWLASWFALPLEGSWNGEQKRRLLAAATEIYFGSWKVTGERDECLDEADPGRAARRGTREGLRRFLQIYLHNITNLSPAEQGGYPHIVESFRERQRLLLGMDDLAALGASAPLWSPSAVGRLHLGVFAREGEARLVSTGDPERDLFHEYAHRFRVFVPASWVRTKTDEEMLRRALNGEKPAHTSFDLCLVEPRLRVGLQATVGVDTVVGAMPSARLACPHETDAPPSRPPRNRLGYDMVLSAPPGDQPTFRVGRETRAGVGTILN